MVHNGMHFLRSDWDFMGTLHVGTNTATHPPTTFLPNLCDKPNTLTHATCQLLFPQSLSLYLFKYLLPNPLTKISSSFLPNVLHFDHSCPRISRHTLRYTSKNHPYTIAERPQHQARSSWKPLFKALEITLSSANSSPMPWSESSSKSQTGPKGS